MKTQERILNSKILKAKLEITVYVDLTTYKEDKKHVSLKSEILINWRALKNKRQAIDDSNNISKKLHEKLKYVRAYDIMTIDKECMWMIFGITFLSCKLILDMDE